MPHPRDQRPRHHPHPHPGRTLRPAPEPDRDPGPSRRALLTAAGAAAGLGACAGAAARPGSPGREGSAPSDATRSAGGGDGDAPRFDELVDQRSSAQPISAEERAARRARLGRLLGERGVDAYFCESGPTLEYLTGVGWGLSERVFGLVVLADGSHLWIAPRFELEKAALVTGTERGGPGGLVVTWEEDQYARHAFEELVSAHGLRSLALDPGTRLLVRDEVRAAGLADEAIRSGRELVVALRGVKDAHELELLRRASELTQRAIEAAAQRVEPGMTGDQVAGLMRAAQRALGLERVWVLALVGPAAAYPHGTDGSGRLGAGDFLLVDTGGSFHGYQSDTTRTWVPHGRPDAEQERVWQTVRDAQRRAYEAIRPGATCAEVDRAARAVIDSAGFGPDYRTFTHRLGHGIGLQGHEDPYFDRGSNVVLAPGMTLSNEPGIYLYGRFGVRIEDIVTVTADGADHFGEWQAGPLSPAGEGR